MQKHISIYDEAYHWAEHKGLLIQAFDEIASTNDLAKEKAWWVPDPLIILAKTQTQGRGRGNNHWIDCGDGNSLLITWSMGLAQAPSHLTAPRVGLALYEAASKTWSDLDFSLKAPNDLLLYQRKIAGLLVEMVQQGSQYRWIVGLGMNFLERPIEFPEATCLNDHTSVRVEDFVRFLNAFHEKLLILMAEIHQPQLTVAEQEDLLHALLKTESHCDLKSVSPEGNLVYASKTVEWSKL